MLFSIYINITFVLRENRLLDSGFIIEKLYFYSLSLALKTQILFEFSASVSMPFSRDVEVDVTQKMVIFSHFTVFIFTLYCLYFHTLLSLLQYQS